MSQLDHRGPENNGPKTGRKLGLCITDLNDSEYKLGQGMGVKRNSNNKIGLGKRLRSSNIFNNK